MLWRRLKLFVNYLVLRSNRYRIIKTLIYSRKLGIITLIVLFTLFYGEYLVYYFSLFLFCRWPSLVRADDSVNALIVADPHLLGIRHGHWFDKLRREWQMERTFHAAVSLFKPDVVFVLGDLFDEGQWASREEIEMYAARFRKIFNTGGRPLYAAVGNHDVGFHYAITERKLKWFYDTFHQESVRMVTIRGVVFVLLNSMAFEGDHCRLCTEAERDLNLVNQTLECVKMGSNNDCPAYHHVQLPAYSRPVLMQHFPLYRFSEAQCNEPDKAPTEIKDIPFRQLWDCLSEEATDKILGKLHPRVAFDGHSHFGCLTYHTIAGQRIPEYTVGSFSCRNTKYPSFLLATFTPTEFAVSKCLGVREFTVYGLYVITMIFLSIFCCVYGRHSRSVSTKTL